MVLYYKTIRLIFHITREINFTSDFLSCYQLSLSLCIYQINCYEANIVLFPALCLPVFIL